MSRRFVEAGDSSIGAHAGMSPSMSRHLELEAVHNFRDFGGYIGKGGRHLRRGRLWRSAGHQAATDADLKAIAALDLALVVDLRTPTERSQAPSRRPTRFRARVVAGEHEAEDTWVAFLKRSELSAASFRSYLIDYYARAPFEPRHLDVFSRYFSSLAEADGAALVHCAAGKDRTGVVVALTHKMLGVSDDDIIADYLLTNHPPRVEARLKIVGDHIESTSGRRPDEAAIRVAMGVEADYLEASFAAICDRFGSIDDYLEEALGVDGRVREALEARLLSQPEENRPPRA
jgi:protein-tyrosine phosphatase